MSKEKNIKELHKDFISYCLNTKALTKTTVRGYIAAFNNFTNLMPKDLALSDLTVETMDVFFERLNTRERKVGKSKTAVGVRNSTLGAYWSKLNVFMDWLYKRGYIAENPFERIDFPKIYYDDRRHLSKDELNKIFTSIATIPWPNNFIKKRNWVIFMVFFCCGIRRGELLGLNVLDIDFDRKQLTVRGETSKSRTDRVIPLNKQAILALQDYLEERRKKRYNKSVALFVSDNMDHRFTEHGLKYLVNKLKEDSGIHFYPHKFRHSFAVNMRHQGADISTIKDAMGHAKIEMTSRYLRCVPAESMRKDIEAISIANAL